MAPDEIDSDRYQKAIAVAQLEDRVSQMPDGVKTLVGDRVYKLSNGRLKQSATYREVIAAAIRCK
ncbi:MAG: hypothetical protein DCF25_11350 [Leptolyngbya foveolarum]|uniref:Uncharacterized protein n=1 Tax=Leptolyngbya foveolarum TaxID=47253 RepID=A0A2W4U7W9_9CYAN|nr:MAG: hypothetical protein DCF25_11350 [Leptolyngbya foveolarum]